MTRTGRLRLGIFSYLEGEGTPRQNFCEATEMYTLADSLGVDVAWVAHHHFARIGGLPSPFIYFAALGARTSQIGFGTAVIQVPTENTVRLAEDVSVLEALFPGRLQLGLGTGFTTDAGLQAFGHPEGTNKRAVYDAAVDTLYGYLRGDRITSDGGVLYPDGGDLPNRIWESPASVEKTIEAARRGSGLLLSRVAIGVSDRDTDDVQRELVDAYYSALPDGVEPRLGLSRTVWTSNDPEAAYESLAAGLLKGAQGQRNGQPSPYQGRPVEDLFDIFSVHWGTPDAVAQSLLAEPLWDEITDLICQVSPGTPTHEQTLAAVELLATEVGPRIGWTPNR